MRVKGYIFLLSIVIVGAVKRTPAHAEAGLLVIGGSAAVRERTVIGTAVEDAVRKAGWSLPAKPLAKKDSDRLLSCEDSVTPWTCIPSTVTGAGIRDVLVVSVETRQAENGAPLVVITGKLIISNPQSFAVRQRFCEHCA